MGCRIGVCTFDLDLHEHGKSLDRVRLQTRIPGILGTTGLLKIGSSISAWLDFVVRCFSVVDFAFRVSSLYESAHWG
jgi:hypothetical protein